MSTSKCFAAYLSPGLSVNVGNRGGENWQKEYGRARAEGAQNMAGTYVSVSLTRTDLLNHVGKQKAIAPPRGPVYP